MFKKEIPAAVTRLKTGLQIKNAFFHPSVEECSTVH